MEGGKSFEGLESFDKRSFNQKILSINEEYVAEFEAISKSYVFFQAVFLAVVFAELFISLFSLSSLGESLLLPLSVSILFLTLFSYFILRIYFQAKKPEQFQRLKESYLQECKDLLNYQEGLAEQHLALAYAASKFSDSLEKRKRHFYHLPPFLDSLERTIETFSCFWHWKDVFLMQECLLNYAVDEHIKIVKVEPTHLEVHAALANAYVMLSGLYMEPHKSPSYDEDSWIPPELYSEEVQEKFRATAKKAIEEFRILSDFAPDDPWVHAQLAYSYHDLQMPEEEIKEYETILRLVPNDTETLFRLGVLYFQEGINSQGLRVYEELRRANYKRAEQLISFYGTGDKSFIS